MIEILNFVFSGFWTFVGMMMLLTCTGNLILYLFRSFLRHRTIRKNGYPPSHCDADGMLKLIKKTEKHDEKRPS